MTKSKYPKNRKYSEESRELSRQKRIVSLKKDFKENNIQFEIIEDDFTNRQENSLFKCLKCDIISKYRAHNILNNGTECRSCGPYKRRDFSQIKNIVESRGYTLISSEKDIQGKNRINTNNEMLIKHNICGKLTSIRVNRFINEGLGCSNCVTNRKKNNIDIQKELDSIHSGKLKLVSEYINRRENITVLCRDCGNRTTAKSFNFTTNKKGCSFCNVSKSEQFIITYLSEEGVSFTQEKTFRNLRHINKLYFDFKIGDVLLESDGIQHFQENDFFGGTEALELTILRDNIKNDFVKRNGLSLIRIYSEDIDKGFLDLIKSGSTTIESFSNYENILLIHKGEVLISRGKYGTPKQVETGNTGDSEDIVSSDKKLSAVHKRTGKK